MRLVCFAAAALVVIFLIPAAANATFPGRNGPIAFVSQEDECAFPEGDECYSFCATRA